MKSSFQFPTYLHKSTRLRFPLPPFMRWFVYPLPELMISLICSKVPELLLLAGKEIIIAGFPLSTSPFPVFFTLHSMLPSVSALSCCVISMFTPNKLLTSFSFFSVHLCFLQRTLYCLSKSPHFPAFTWLTTHYYLVDYCWNPLCSTEAASFFTTAPWK